eukprot:CAMPEP_0197628280 /NCGR_PEP_ID=MMETSP1338-20131121/6650_1 /TAXON_ID=43686 ORGANISM="Pelagodinium beii, Strain RCC1491" /NCGR_SAMPLE_ID=MMETSP1338 /ASSEMBLY_ACC=CAM_ASM_000754 /LENGTH=224 /DNA_ID=CAMNT_0043199231 /DNA_START=61 /DNA_END=735 /DNA_ORIENTATION=-
MIAFPVLLIACGAQLGSAARVSVSNMREDACEFPCGAATAAKDGISFTIGSGKDITYTPSATTCLTKCSVVTGGMFGSSCADKGGEKVAKDGSSKLCCTSMTCPETTTTTTAEPTLEEKFECKPGQGAAATTYHETGDNSFESCAALCDADAECQGFDFTEAESTHPELFGSNPTMKKKDSCRLYKANKPRFDEKSHRTYCSKQGSEEEEPVEEEEEPVEEPVE